MSNVTEQLKLQIPIPPGKRLVSHEVRVLSFELDAPGDADRLTIATLPGWVSERAHAQLGDTLAYVLAIELRPDTPTTVLARVLLPEFA